MSDYFEDCPVFLEYTVEPAVDDYNDYSAAETLSTTSGDYDKETFELSSASNARSDISTDQDSRQERVLVDSLLGMVSSTQKKESLAYQRNCERAFIKLLSTFNQPWRADSIFEFEEELKYFYNPIGEDILSSCRYKKISTMLKTFWHDKFPELFHGYLSEKEVTMILTFWSKRVDMPKLCLIWIPLYPSTDTPQISSCWTQEGELQIKHQRLIPEWQRTCDTRCCIPAALRNRRSHFYGWFLNPEAALKHVTSARGNDQETNSIDRKATVVVRMSRTADYLYSITVQNPKCDDEISSFHIEMKIENCGDKLQSKFSIANGLDEQWTCMDNLVSNVERWYTNEQSPSGALVHKKKHNRTTEP